MVWLDTDKQRCGLTPFMMGPDASFARYAQWALDVPMYMIKRGSKVIANTGQPFRSYWQDGFEGERATLGDWILHLNTLFPEVRLQRTIELRSTDAQKRALSPAVPALWAGLLYDAQSLAACELLVEPMAHDVLEAARKDIAKRGLRAEVGGQPLRAIAERMIELSMEGLARRKRVDAEGRDERVYLEPLAALTLSGRCPGDLLLEGLDGRADDLRGEIALRTWMTGGDQSGSV
jgi:glutamate--cysteine ligase